MHVHTHTDTHTHTHIRNAIAHRYLADFGGTDAELVAFVFRFLDTSKLPCGLRPSHEHSIL
jgi:hypothetical protein